MLEAFRKSQNRAVSMAIIHEELYKGNEIDTLDFAAYLKKLTADLFNSYSVQKDNIKLKLVLRFQNIAINLDIEIDLKANINNHR